MKHPLVFRGKERRFKCVAERKDAEEASAVYGHNLAGEQHLRSGAGSNPVALSSF